MNPLGSVGRSDLLRLRNGPDWDEAMAECLGYHRTEPAPSPSPPPPPPEAVSAGTACAGSGEATDGRTIPPPAEPLPRLTFLAPVRLETRRATQRQVPPGNPIRDEELEVAWGHRAPDIQPLVPWGRLAGYLRRRLGTSIHGEQVDVRRLVQRLGTGEAIVRVPRVRRLAWASQVEIWWDATPEMVPFIRDAQWLLARLKRERGPSGLRCRVLRGLPSSAWVGTLPAGVPVLAISALGQLGNWSAVRQAWLQMARRLRSRGHPLQALCPCPRERWDAALARAWNSSVWDRRPRLPRAGGQSPLPHRPATETAQATNTLLDILSPALRIESPLLRLARLRLGPRANVGTEWDAWHHDEAWRCEECFGLRPGPGQEARLERRSRLTGDEGEASRAIAPALARHHATSSLVLAVEVAMRARASGTPDAGDPAELVSLLRRVTDRLRLQAAQPGSDDNHIVGLAEWFVRMTDRLTPAMRAHPELSEVVAVGLALAHTALATTHVRVPPGTDGPVFRAASQEAASLLPTAKVYAVVFDWAGPAARLRLLPEGRPPEARAWELGTIEAATRDLHVVLDPPFAEEHRHDLTAASEGLDLALPPEPGGMTVETTLHALRLEPLERPYWASRMGYGPQGLWATAEVDGAEIGWRWDLHPDSKATGDRSAIQVRLGGWEVMGETPSWATRLWADGFGVAAEFKVGRVAFVLRWIPPGRFRMGSPPDEPGRYGDEGPQHEVTISRGFWLGETPVTQDQWRIVVEATELESGGIAISSKPSQFLGPWELPVECVSHHDCLEYCKRLNRLLGQAPGFGLPTEAQWEYACRAGTTTALYDGRISLHGANRAPELDPIAWYGGNSGLAMEVENPYDARGWSEKQYPDTVHAGPHRVKGKLPNPWGLYDTLGNVWEWCLDTKRSYGSDPVHDPGGSDTPAAPRVVRGGSWSVTARRCRAAYRYVRPPGYRNGSLGFRLAAGLGLEPKIAAEPPSGAGPVD